MIARREDVRQLLMRLDQEGVERRKSRKFRLRIYRRLGPNYASHMINSLGSLLTGASTDIPRIILFRWKFLCLIDALTL